MRMNSMLKVGALLLAVLAVLVAGLVVAVKSVDLNQVKELLTSQVQAATGRTLIIAGPLEMRLGLIPRLVADGVSLSNPPGSTRPEMVTIKHFELEISLLPLLKREIRINRLVVSAPDILIETEAKGPGNLDFSHAAKKSEPKPSSTEGSSTYRLHLEEVTIENGVLTLYDRSTGQTDSIELHKLTIQPDRTSDALLTVRLAAKALGRMVEIDGTVGRFNAAIEGKPWPVHLQSGIAGLTINIEGAIADLFAFRGLNLQLAVQGAELSQMVELAGIAKSEIPQSLGPFKVSTLLSDPGGTLDLTDVNAEIGKRDSLLLNARGTVRDLAGAREVNLALAMESENLAGLSGPTGSDMPPLGPLQLAGQLQGRGNTWKLSDFKASLAQSDMSGQLIVDIAKRPHLSGKVTSNTLNLNDFTQMNQSGSPATKPVKSAGRDNRIFPNEPLPAQTLRALDMDLTLQAGKLITGDLLFSDIAAELHLDDGRLTLKPFHTGLAGGNIDGEVSLDATGKVPAAVVNLTARQVELGKLTDRKTISGGKSDLKVNLKGRGESVRALMATITGETVLSVGEGKIQNKAMNWAVGDLLSQVVGALNPLAKSEDTTALSCAVVRFTIHEGIATADKGIAMRTDKIDVVGSGTVDLRSETLDLGINPRPRQGVGLSLSGPLAGMTRLRGTFSNPSVGIDSEGTLRSAASMGAAAATGGLSMLGELMIDRVTADSDPCRTALGQAPAQQKGRTQKPKEGGLFQGMFGR